MSQNSRIQGRNFAARHLSSISFLLVMSLGYAVYALDRTVLSSVLKPMEISLGLSSLQVGLLGSAQYIGVLALVFTAGHLSDRYGRSNMIVLGVAIFTSFTWMIGLSSNFLEAFLFRLVSGLGEGIFWPVAMAAVASHFKNRKGLALGVFYVGFDAGSVAGLSIGGAAYYFTADWRTAFYVAPLLGLFVMVSAATIRKRFITSDQENKERLRIGTDALALLRRKEVILIMAFALFATWASVWQVVFLPYYFSTVLNFTGPKGVLSAALLSSLVAVSGAAGKIVFGGTSDLWKRNRLLASVSLAVLLSYAAFFASANFVLDLFSAISMGFFSSSVFPILQALMTDRCKGKVGTALGLTTTAQSFATVISPVLTASLFAFGVGRAMALNAMIPSALSFVVALFLKDPKSQSF